MNANFYIPKENKEIANEAVFLMKHEDTDPSDFRRMFSQLDVVSRDYVIVIGCGQRLVFSNLFLRASIILLIFSIEFEIF